VGEKREGKGREGGREGGRGGKREGSVKWRVGLKILKKMPDVMKHERSFTRDLRYPGVKTIQA
jgi:hypothetical protein